MFRERYSLEQRQKLADAILQNQPGKIPVILEKKRNSPNIDKYKFLVSGTSNIPKFICNIRKEFDQNIKQEQAIYALIISKGNISKCISPCINETFNSIHDKHKCDDNFLYITIVYEDCFGGFLGTKT